MFGRHKSGGPVNNTTASETRDARQQGALYGVNLGGWLVLERWITPSVFEDSKACDEYSLSLDAPAEVVTRIRKHRDSFITKADFVWLKKQGIEAVRLPVGHGVFGDAAPYLASVEYV